MTRSPGGQAAVRRRLLTSQVTVHVWLKTIVHHQCLASCALWNLVVLPWQIVLRNCLLFHAILRNVMWERGMASVLYDNHVWFCKAPSSFKLFYFHLHCPWSSPLLVTLPVSNASAEGSFSSLHRLKTYMRSTVSQDWLTGLALLCIQIYQC